MLNNQRFIWYLLWEPVIPLSINWPQSHSQSCYEAEVKDYEMLGMWPERARENRQEQTRPREETGKRRAVQTERGGL